MSLSDEHQRSGGHRCRVASGGRHLLLEARWRTLITIYRQALMVMTVRRIDLAFYWQSSRVQSTHTERQRVRASIDLSARTVRQIMPSSTVGDNVAR